MVLNLFSTTNKITWYRWSPCTCVTLDAAKKHFFPTPIQITLKWMMFLDGTLRYLAILFGVEKFCMINSIWLFWHTDDPYHWSVDSRGPFFLFASYINYPQLYLYYTVYTCERCSDSIWYDFEINNLEWLFQKWFSYWAVLVLEKVITNQMIFLKTSLHSDA